MVLGSTKRSKMTKTTGIVTSLLLLLLLTLSAEGQTGNAIVFSVMEELPAAQLVGNVATASGIRDEVTAEEYNRLRYQILSPDGLKISSLFTIHSVTGALFTNAMIDREQVCDNSAVTCQLQFDVTVKVDVVVIKLLNVIVVIEDKNDNAPSFPSTDLPLSISEASPNGSEISITGAIDRDAGLKSEIKYWMSDSSVFGLKEEKLLDVSLLKLVLLKTLDRETESSYNLEIYAKDGDTATALTGTLSVTITVTDVNDHRPEFSKSVYNFTIKENAELGSLVGTIEASDEDIDENGRVTYHFSSLTSSKVLELFVLNEETGDVTVKAALQYESRDDFQAVVEAKDHGGSPRSTQAILVIKVEDAGNTPPKMFLTLADTLYQDTTLLSEDLPVGFFIGTVSYIDNDEGDNGLVECTSLNPHFTLQRLPGAQEKRYKIEIKMQLDREALTGNDMKVVVRCTDKGSPRLSSEMNFTVMISDANDNSPIFKQPEYFGEVIEGATRTDNIVQVSATDADENRNSEVTYQLSANSSNAFTVDPLTGWISLVGAVDRETSNVIPLTVLAVDRGEKIQMTGTALVSVTVVDVNDNSPEIINTEYRVKENQPEGTLVTNRIDAHDKDTGPNGDMRFQLLSDPSSSFSVSERGRITTTRIFDREKVAHYFIVVRVRDMGSPPLTSTATLTISIEDTNDHAPRIIFPSLPNNNAIDISATLSPGTVFSKINATDDDVGKNAKLIYLIAEGNPHKLFGIDNATGTLFVAKRLTTSRESQYRLTISVQDSGNPRLHESAHLFLNIDFSNATMYEEQVDMEQRYIIISGVIAGVTFVIAVVVIFIIIKLRKSDPGRGAQPIPKSKSPDSPLATGHPVKETSLPLHGLNTIGMGREDKDAGFGGDGNGGKGRDPNTSFDSHLTNGSMTFIQRPTLTQDLMEHPGDPGFSLFSEGPEGRMVSEDLNSDTSGEMTTSDSGRGASDGEENTGGTSPPPSYHALSPTGTSRVPPFPSNQGQHNSQQNPSNYTRELTTFRDLDRTARIYASQKDFEKSKRTPNKVRFSLDDHSVDQLRNSGSNNLQHPPHHHQQSKHSNPPLTTFNIPPTKEQLLKNFTSGANPASRRNENETHRPPLGTTYYGDYRNQPMSQRHFHNPHEESQSGSTVPLSRDAVAKHERFHQKKKPHSNNLYPLLHPRNLPLSHHNRSMDDDDDDGSTTTSGSYAIEGVEDNLNISVEC